MSLDIQASINTGVNNTSVLLYLSPVTLQLALDALNTYVDPATWYPAPDDMDAAQNYMDTAARELMSSSMIYAGMMIPYAIGGAVALPPNGWLFCLGGEADKAAYPDLYAVIGNTYGTPTNPDNFVLPNMATRAVVGTDASFSGAFSIAHAAGSQTATLTVDQMPAHTHKYDRGISAVTSGPVPVSTASGIAPQGTTYPTGGGQPFSIMQPYIAMYWLIKT